MKRFSPPLECDRLSCELLGISFHHSSLAVSRFAVDRPRGSFRRRSLKRVGDGWGWLETVGDGRGRVRTSRDGGGLQGTSGEGTSDVS